MDSNKNDAMKIQEEKRQARTLENMEIKLSEQMEMMKQLITTSAVISIDELCFHFRTAVQTVWGIERSGFFNGREKWAKGFENQRV